MRHATGKRTVAKIQFSSNEERGRRSETKFEDSRGVGVQFEKYWSYKESAISRTEQELRTGVHEEQSQQVTLQVRPVEAIEFKDIAPEEIRVKIGIKK